jgi:hypothetical protein
MVGHVKHNFFVRYRAFESWAHLNQLAKQWLAEEADQRVQGTVKEVVAERFQREAPYLKPLPAQRNDTSYLELRRAGWGWVCVAKHKADVRRAAAPAECADQAFPAIISCRDSPGIQAMMGRMACRISVDTKSFRLRTTK